MNFNYLSNIDPNKHPVQNFRFPKLTLSKHKTQNNPINTLNTLKNNEKAQQSSTIINPTQKLLIFDGADDDNKMDNNNIIISETITIKNDKNEKVNKILISTSSSSPSLSTNVQTDNIFTLHIHPEKQLSHRLHLSDSDETNCSSISDEQNNKLNENQQQHLVRKESEDLFSNITSNSNNTNSSHFYLSQKHQIILSDISERISNLDFQSNDNDNDNNNNNDNDNVKINAIENRTKSKSTELNYSVQTISSKDTSSNMDSDLTRSPLSSNEINQIIEISDSSSASENKNSNKDESSFNINVSNVEQESEKGSINTITSSVMHQINNFFDNIPSLYSNKDDNINNVTNISKTRPSIVTSTNKEICILANETATESDLNDNDHNEQSIIISETTLNDDGNDEDYDADHGHDNSENGERKDSDEDVNDNDKNTKKTSQIINSTPLNNNVKNTVISSKENIGQINIRANFKINIKISDLNSSATNSSNSTLSSNDNDDKNESIINNNNNNNNNNNIENSTTDNNNNNKSSSSESTSLENNYNKYININVTTRKPITPKTISPLTKSKQMQNLKCINSNKKINFITPDHAQESKKSSLSSKKKVTTTSTTSALTLSTRTTSSTIENKFLTKIKKDSLDFTYKSNLATKDTNSSDNIAVDVIDHNADDEINENAEAMLDEIYGTKWRTPELIKKCTSLKKLTQQQPLLNKNEIIPLHEQPSPPPPPPPPPPQQQQQQQLYSPRISVRFSEGFSQFRRNIENDFDSTRMETAIENRIVIKKTQPPMKHQPLPLKENNINNSIDKSIDEIISSPFFQKNNDKIDKKQHSNNDDENNKSLPYNIRRRRKNVKYMYDSDSNDDNSSSKENNNNKNNNDDDSNITDDNDDDDDEWNLDKIKKNKKLYSSPSSSSVSDFTDDEDKPGINRKKIPSTKKIVEKKVTKKKCENNDDKIIYLDLTYNEVIEVSENEAIVVEPSQKDLEINTKKLCDNFKTPLLTNKNIVGATSIKSTKRKLFTPNYDNVAIHADLINDKQEIDGVISTKTINNNNKDENVKLSYPIPEFLTTPFQIADKKKTVKHVPGTKVINKKTTTDEEKVQVAITKLIPQKKIEQTTKKRYYGFLHSLDVTIPKELCHPDSLKFRNNFKTNKIELTTILYELYNERVFDNKLTVPITWNKKLLNTAGRCINTRKSGIRNCRVELSDKVLTSGDRLRCTLIHELCHAATWNFNGENGHGATWKNWTFKVGKIFPELPKIGVSHSYDIEYKYTYKCTLCNAKSYAHSKSKKVENIRCSCCHGAIEIFLNKKDKEGNPVFTPVKQATGFAAFVKEFYQHHKKSNLTHAQVMKQLSTAYGGLSVDQKKKY